MIKLKVFKQKNIDADTYNEVERIGMNLLDYIQSPEIIDKLNSANSPGNNSSLVQNVFLEKAIELGFQSEKKKLFESIPTQNLRPDFYMKVKNSGIIIEVERGKTIMNNMDMLDIWKCHLCEVANHLFIFVPLELKHNEKSKPYNCFDIVSNRMKPFFDKNNYTSVHSLWVFGY